eukprot:1161505-Pelagomonas_calceolata.AAC.8
MVGMVGFEKQNRERAYPAIQGSCPAPRHFKVYQCVRPALVYRSKCQRPKPHVTLFRIVIMIFWPKCM